uniref:Plasmodium variant antigen protein Cir/Yir/Bir n=1 Tax=Parastrongyloides trichosuri TaxID=131310 RepID=A0A0N4ZTX7_PARTI
MKEDAYYEKNSFFLGSITKYFEMIQDKDEITLFDLASLLKCYKSPDISDYAFMEYIRIYKNALKMIVSRKRNSNNIQQVEKFLETNTGSQTKEAVKEQFKEIDYIDKTTSNSMKYFTSSISSYLNSNKFSSLEMHPIQ